MSARDERAVALGEFRKAPGALRPLRTRRRGRGGGAARRRGRRPRYGGRRNPAHRGRGAAAESWIAAASLHGISLHGSRAASERRPPKTCGALRPAPSDCVCRSTRKCQNLPPVARPPTLPLSGIRRRRRPSGRSRKRTPAAPSATTSRRAPSRGKSTGAAASIQLVTAIGKSTDSPQISSASP